MKPCVGIPFKKCPDKAWLPNGRIKRCKDCSLAMKKERGRIWQKLYGAEANERKKERYRQAKAETAKAKQVDPDERIFSPKAAERAINQAMRDAT